MPGRNVLEIEVTNVAANRIRDMDRRGVEWKIMREINFVNIRFTDDPLDRCLIASLYLAMMADTSLRLIGSTDRLLIEGRFATDTVFIRALAALRPRQAVYTCGARDHLAYGALRLVVPGLTPSTALAQVAPLDLDLREFADDWRRHAGEAPDNKRPDRPASHSPGFPEHR